MRFRILNFAMLVLLGTGMLLATQPAAADQMFIAIGDQILRAPKAPATSDPAEWTTPIYYQDGVTFNGIVYAGDGLLYVCAETDSGSSIFRFDPLAKLPLNSDDPPAERPWGLADSQVEIIDSTVGSSRCGTVDVDGSLVVASGAGRIYQFDKVAGTGLYDPNLCPQSSAPAWPVEFCYPYGKSAAFPSAMPLEGSDALGEVVDVAYFYNSDFLSLVEASSGGGQGNGQGQGQGGGSEVQLLRSIWPDYQEQDENGDAIGFVTEGCPAAPNQPEKNTKTLLEALSRPARVGLSGGEIYVADGSELFRVDISDETDLHNPACVDEPVAIAADCVSFGNLSVASLVGDVDGYSIAGGPPVVSGGSLFVGTGSKNKDAVVYSVDACNETEELIFPKRDWPTVISGLAVVPASVEASLCPEGDGCGSDEYEVTFDGSHAYTLEAACDGGGSLVGSPATLETVLARIRDIPPVGDQNTPDFNDIIGSPSAFPGYEGFPWLWEVEECGPGPVDPQTQEPYERHIIASYQRGANLRIGASDSADSIDAPCEYPDAYGFDLSNCVSEYIELEFNVPWDPELVSIDPIGGRRRGTQTYLSAAALANTQLAEFCGYQSPLLPSADSPGAIPVLYPLPTNLPVKFKLEKLEDDGSICGSGTPIDNAVVMISVARIKVEGSPTIECPDFEVIFPLVPNGAGSADPTPLYDDPGQPSGNYHFNLSVNSTDYCDGLYLITSTFLTDNAVEQQTLFYVDSDGSEITIP